MNFTIAEVIDTKKAFKSGEKDENGDALFNGSILVKLNATGGIFSRRKARYAAPCVFNKRIPLIGEQVIVFQAPHTEESSRSNKQSRYYYFSTVNSIDDVTQHNFPRLFDQEYSPNLVKGNKPKILADYEELGYTIKKEPSQTKPLQPFEGDDIWEGRFGQSIRFTRHYDTVNSPGKGVYEQKGVQYWKGKGIDDPLMILKVKTPSSGNSYDIEDIGKDESSIYLTSTHKILKFKPGFNKHSATRAMANWSDSSQIVMNSGRVIVNAQEERAFIVGKEQVVVTGKKVLLQSDKYSVDLDDLMDWLNKSYAEFHKTVTASANYTTAMGPTGPATNASQVTKILTADFPKTFKTPA